MSSVSAELSRLDEFEVDIAEGPSLPYINLNHNNNDVMKNRRRELKISQSLSKIKSYINPDLMLRQNEANPVIDRGQARFNGSKPKGGRFKSPSPILLRKSLKDEDSPA